MRKTLILVSLLSLFAAVPVKADSVLDAFSAKASSSCVEFKYVFYVKADIPLTGKGSGSVYGDSFHISGNGVDMWCDGKFRWSVDEEAKEVIVESVSETDDAYAVNPALFITDVSSSFREVSTGNSVFRGKTYHCVTLVPKVSGSISGLSLYFSGNELKGASVTVKDGTVTEFELSDISFSAAARNYSFDTDSLGSDWLVTELY